MCFINWALGGAAGAWYTCSLMNWYWRRLYRIFTALWIPHHQNSTCFLIYFLNLNVHRAASSSGRAHTPLRELVSAQSCVGICSSIFMGLAVCTGTLSCWDREAVTKKLQVHFVCPQYHQTTCLIWAKGQAQTIKPSLYQGVDSVFTYFRSEFYMCTTTTFWEKRFCLLAESFRKRHHSHVCTLNKEVPLAAG